MKVKKIINNLELVVAELELHHHAGKAVQSGLNLCAKITENGEDKIIPLNTPDGRPIFMNMENAIPLDLTNEWTNFWQDWEHPFNSPSIFFTTNWL